MKDYLIPWDKESEKYFRRLMKDRIVYIDNNKFTRAFGRRYPTLFDENQGYLDIGRIDRRNKSMIALRPGITLAPIQSPPTRITRIQKYKFFRIY